MPTTYNIPSRTEHHCSPCEFLKQTNMICSRLHGITCDYVCKHPDCYGDEPLSEDLRIRDKQVVLRAQNAEHGRLIGDCDIQPDFCPLKREPPPLIVKN